MSQKSRMGMAIELRRIGAAGATKLFMVKDRMVSKLRETKGQGTTEYAILVGVLVVIAIIAVIAFRGKLQELWSAISEGINGL